MAHMKAVVGVGFTTHCLSGVDIFARLKFPDSEAVLVHAVEPVLPDGGFMAPGALGPIAEIQEQRKEDGEKKLAEIAADLTARGIPNRSVVTFGRAAHQITETAKEERADLIIAGSDQKGALENFLMGSVTRALVVEAQRSILVGKRTATSEGGVSAVFATDHSEYADKCLDLLVRLAPAGLERVLVVCADTSDSSVRSVASGLHEGLVAKNQAVVDKLKGIATHVDQEVIEGRANDVIDAAMKKTGADLLILGAHGHGFLERLLMGSTAMHMVGNSPWNVLVLRV
jgi:nucleotide-binding universal stress UspA family protein